MNKKKPALPYREIINRLELRYPDPEYAFLQQVRNETGGGSYGARYADAIAFNLWPSRGLEIHGIEIKVSRADWLKEMRDPAKAADIQAYCDRWWLVVGSADIVKDGELPPTWGLLTPHGKGFRAEPAAPKLEPKPPSILFMASIARRLQELKSPRAVLQKATSEARRDGEEWGRKREQQDAKYANDQLERLKKDIRDFKAGSGINMIGYSWTDIGEAVRTVLNGGQKHRLRDIKRLQASTQTILDKVTAEIQTLEA